MKNCIKCGFSLSKDCFYKGKNSCKECLKTRQKAYQKSVYTYKKEEINKRQRERYRSLVEKGYKKPPAKYSEEVKARQKKYYENNREKILARQREYYEKNAERIRANFLSRSEQNPEYHRERSRLWYSKNKTKKMVRASVRRASKILATPPWLTREHLQEIQNLYNLAKDCQLVSGQKYHVDHIVPLKGRDVCGLHVPWNLQVLPCDLNLKKGNQH